ncbi:NAD-dependent deacylase [Pukyongiella litopenaei]|uniref:NAD-dependent protein deacylase n=1 Tax=Pukyongiella litopenaei TaxID=2605946 RepID=A0A2S0MVS5_9RHOB|nr:NAD-dependent deacylase [Pukyongiella litopenaei]AVO39821.1 NAD-dependent deacylase [Pukyongiella litopenaei]
MKTIVILTGAGISAESGLDTFRDAGGIWTRYPLEDVATPEGFARDPDLVQGFYNARRAKAAAARPNPAHVALGLLQRDWPGDVVIVTQNVDGLHEAGGADRVIHMHGELSRALCSACGHRWDAPENMAADEPCPQCRGSARPDIVWFGEMPYHMDRIEKALMRADLFAAIGTSGQVWPAAGFVQNARAVGAHTVEINLEPSEVTSEFAESRLGPASETVPVWVADLLSGVGRD